MQALETVPRPGASGWLPGLLFLLLLGAALAARLAGSPLLDEQGRLTGLDKDTLRRIERVRALAEPGRPYPWREPREGYPEGTLSHWTLPMDGVIVALDKAAAPWWPGMGRFQAGAILAGPLLGGLSLLAFFLLAARLLGAWRGLVAAAVYGLSSTAIVITQLGNGDHQSLQHLCAVVTLLCFALLAEGQDAWWAGPLAGLSLGLGFWVTAETLALQLLLAGAVLLHLVPPRTRGERAVVHLGWVVPALFLSFLGDRLEHPGTWMSFEWDQVSGFQLYPQAALAAFLLLVRFQPGPLRGRPAAGLLVPAAGAAALALAPWLFCSGLREALREQAALYRQTAAWTRNAVNEFRPLLLSTGILPTASLAQRYTPLIYLLPLFLAAFLGVRALRPGTRAALLLLGLGLAGLAALQVKLSHLFLVLYPLFLVLGGERLVGLVVRREKARRHWRAAGAAALVGIALVQAPWRREAPEPAYFEAAANMLERIQRLRPRETGPGRRDTVLAPWHLGADILLHTDKRIVASGYHRNLPGIHDAYRAFLAKGWGQAEPIFRRRGVRWVVAAFDPSLLLQAQAVVDDLEPVARLEGDRVLWLPAAHETLWNHLVGPDPLHSERLRCLWESETSTEFEGRLVPLFRIYEVRYPEEG